MASRQIKMPVKDGSDKDVDEAPSQRKRPESGRYLLQVDGKPRAPTRRRKPRNRQRR
jgi:hypothetical protein